MNTETNIKLIKKTDWFIIFFLCLFPFALKINFFFFPSLGNYFIIKYYKNGEEILENINANESRTVVIDGEIGKMTIEFDKEKGARVASSTCSCQICVNLGWTRADSIACLPNKVVITKSNRNITSQKESVDAVIQ